MAVEINHSDPGAVPGASTQARSVRKRVSAGAKQDRRGRKGRVFSRYCSAVIGLLQ